MENDILYTAKPHWYNYILPIILICTIYLSPFGIYYIFYFKMVKIELNEKAFSYTYWLFNRKQIDIKLEKIESIQVKRNLFDMIFWSGTVIVSGTWWNNDPVKWINKPFILKEMIENKIS